MVRCRSYESAVVPRVDHEVEEATWGSADTPRGAAVVAFEQLGVSDFEAIDSLPARAQDVEVGSPEQRYRLPGPSGISRLHEAKEPGQLRAGIGMPGSEEVIRPDDGETHRVLVAIPDPGRPRSSTGYAEQAGVGSDEDTSVVGIDADSVDVNRPGD
jgi:hypothetical protein